MWLRGYKLERVFSPSYSNFDLDGMPMGMARHNRRAGTTSYKWVKRRGNKVREICVD